MQFTDLKFQFNKSGGSRLKEVIASTEFLRRKETYASRVFPKRVELTRGNPSTWLPEATAQDLSRPIGAEQEGAGNVKPLREEVGGTKDAIQPIGAKPGGAGLWERAVSGK